MDAGTPNPNKPRLSRRLLSHFTLTLSVLLALSFITLAVVGPTTQEVEAVVPLVVVGAGIAIAAMAGFIAGWYANNILKDQSDASGNLVAAYREQMANSYNNYLELAESTALNEAELIELTSNYYARLGEMAALQLYQELESQGAAFVYDRNYIFEEAGIYDDLFKQYEMTTAGFRATFDTLDQLQQTFVGDYASMTLTKGNAVGTAATPIDMVPVTKLTYAGSTGTKYHVFDSNASFYAYQTGITASHTFTLLYPNGTVAGSKTFEMRQDNAPVYKWALRDMIPNIENGSHVLNLQIPIQTDVHIFCDRAMKSFVGTNDGSQTPGILVWETGNAQTYANYLGGFTGYPLSTDFNVTLNGDGASDVALKDSANAIGSAYSQIITLGTIVNNYAQTYFNYLVTNGDDGIPFTPPSVVLIDPAQMAEMSMAELYAIYLSYMMAMEQGFLDGYTVKLSDVPISIEALKLVCRGSIYNETGVLQHGNTTIFTPFPTLEPMTLALGNNTLTQPGFIIKWGNGTSISELYADPSNGTFHPETMEYISFGLNWTLVLEEIYYEGESVETVTVTVADLTVYYPDLDGPTDPPSSLSDLEWLLSRWYYFAIVAGIICLLAAISFRNVAIIAVGLILLAAGGIGYWMAGDFSLLGGLGLSIQPPNLTAWLQHLR